MANRISGLALIALFFVGLFALNGGTPAQESGKKWSAVIPRVWDDEAIQTLELPLADPAGSPKHVSSDYYYRIPVRAIYKSYPVYHPDKEPSAYLDWLKKRQPQIVFDASKLKTELNWVAAGKLAFDAPIEFVSEGTLFSAVRDRVWYNTNKVPITRDGVLPFMRYVVREPGKVELGILSCAMCHTRVMPDGTTIKGAQGNFPDDRSFAYETMIDAAQASDKEKPLKELRDFMRKTYAVPWLASDPNAQPDRMTLEEITSVLEAIPPGACARQGSSAFYPARIPDLIGVRDRLYLDASGLVRHRTIGDLMRYAALNQGADLLSLYGQFRPKGELPDPSTQTRYSDEQLYALALFVYSLKAPPNPNKIDALAARGQKVFDREGCAVCHAPPHYTNNKTDSGGWL